MAPSDEPSFPPLLSGEATRGDPFALAAARARAGTEAGLIVHKVRPERLQAALVLAPEEPLQQAMGVVLAIANGFGDAFGALAPSEVAAQFDWPGGFRINGGRCGGLRAAADTRDPDTVPGWLVVALELPFIAAYEAEPGETPDVTSLREEGCSGIEPLRMLESWSRHLLVRINDFLEDGLKRNHADWTGRAFALGEEVEVQLPAGRTETGRFTGLDEWGGLLLQSGSATRLIPLTAMLEDA